MGFRGVWSADIMLDDVRVPRENIIVPAGGFARLFTAFSIERLGNATMSLAIAQTALDRSAKYVLERRQFGRRIADFQFVQGAIADMVMRVESARLLVYAAATGAGRGAPNALAASVAKCVANEAAKVVSDLALQVHGGYGYVRDFPVERALRDVRVTRIYEGTSEIQRLVIARAELARITATGR